MGRKPYLLDTQSYRKCVPALQTTSSCIHCKKNGRSSRWCSDDSYSTNSVLYILFLFFPYFKLLPWGVVIHCWTRSVPYIIESIFDSQFFTRFYFSCCPKVVIGENRVFVSLQLKTIWCVTMVDETPQRCADMIILEPHSKNVTDTKIFPALNILCSKQPVPMDRRDPDHY